MNNDFEQCKKVFDMLLKADNSIWEPVIEIQNSNNKQLEEFIQPLMNLRGEIHVEFMRPIYQKYPEIAKIAGFDIENESDDD